MIEMMVPRGGDITTIAFLRIPTHIYATDAACTRKYTRILLLCGGSVPVQAKISCEKSKTIRRPIENQNETICYSTRKLRLSAVLYQPANALKAN